MLTDIRKAFNQHILSLDWMDEGTKGKAVEKLEMMEFHVRAPSTLVRIHFIIVMLRWTGLAPWEFEFPCPGSLTSTFLQVGYAEGFPGLEDEEPLQLAEKSFFGNAVPSTRPCLVNKAGYEGIFGPFWAESPLLYL